MFQVKKRNFSVFKKIFILIVESVTDVPISPPLTPSSPPPPRCQSCPLHAVTVWGGEDGGDPALTGVSPQPEVLHMIYLRALQIVYGTRLEHFYMVGRWPFCSRPTLAGSGSGQEVLHFICNKMKGLYEMSLRKASQA